MRTTGNVFIVLAALMLIGMTGCEKKPAAPANTAEQANAVVPAEPAGPAVPPVKSVAELNARIADARPGDVILVPAGVYEVDEAQGVQIVDRQGITLKAAGGGAAELVSRKPDGQIVVLRGSADVTLEGFTIYHAVDVECTATCVSIEGCSGVTIQDNDISGSGAYGVGVWGLGTSESSDIRILRNSIHDCSYWGIEIHSKGGTIANNRFADNGGGGDDITGDLEGLDVHDNR